MYDLTNYQALYVMKNKKYVISEHGRIYSLNKENLIRIDDKNKNLIKLVSISFFEKLKFIKFKEFK